MLSQRSCPNLKCLRLAWCSRITDQGVVRNLKALSHLRELDLSLTGISNKSCSVLLKLKTLEVMDLSATRITGEGATTIFSTGPCSFTNLTIRFIQTMDQAILEHILATCPRLHFLDVTHCGIDQQRIQINQELIKIIQQRNLRIQGVITNVKASTP